MLQPRCKIDPVTLQAFQVWKARVTFHLSFGRRANETDNRRPYSINAQTEPEDTVIRVPSYRTFATACAVVDEMAVDPVSGVRVASAEASAVDASQAYCYILHQRLDRWQQAAFLWTDGSHLSLRVVFGGSFGPQRWSAAFQIPWMIAEGRLAALQTSFPPPLLVETALQ